MDVPLVRIEGAGLNLGGRRVLEAVDLGLESGETLALLGPNGAGKTSLMRLAAGRLAPSSGRIRVAGADPFRSGAARRRIGWVPQEIALYPRLTVAENLAVFGQFAGVSRRERRSALAAALDIADLAALAERPVGLLSGGYRRRVNIAASLMHRPRLVLLDEPTSGVDLAARAAIHAVLDRLKAAGTAILLATHDFAEAERLAARVAFVAQGRIVRAGPIADLLAELRAGTPELALSLTRPMDDSTERVLRHAGFAPAEPGGLTWHAVKRGGLDGAALLDALRRQGVPVAEVRIQAPGLESLYRDAISARGDAVREEMARRVGSAR